MLEKGDVIWVSQALFLKKEYSKYKLMVTLQFKYKALNQAFNAMLKD